MADQRARRRGPYAKTRGRLTAVADATLAIIEADGHAAVSFQEVARRAGLTEAQVLYHFPSKDHLLVGALERADAVAIDETGADLESMLADDDEPDPEEVMSAFVERGLLNMNLRRLYLEQRSAAVDPEHPAHAYVTRRQRTAAEYYIAYLRRMHATGYAHPDVEPERFGRQLVALWEGLEAQWMVDPSFDLAAELGAAVRLAARHDEMLATERGGSPSGPGA